MMGRRRKGFSRIEPGALIGLAVLALAYWGTVATLVMARNANSVSDLGPAARIEIGPTTIRPETAPRVRIPAVRPWCFSEGFRSERIRYGQPRQIGLALWPPCSMPLRYGLIRSTRPDYGMLIADGPADRSR